MKLSHPSSTCVPTTLLSESIATVSKAAMLSKLTSSARSISLYHSSSSSQPEVVSVNLASVSGLKRGIGMIASTTEKMMDTTDNKRVTVSNHHNHNDSIQKKQHYQQSNTNGKQEDVIDLVDEP